MSNLRAMVQMIQDKLQLKSVSDLFDMANNANNWSADGGEVKAVQDAIWPIVEACAKEFTCAKCDSIRIEGSSFCWTHIVNHTGICVVHKCETETPEKVSLCRAHMDEYIASAQDTGRYGMQSWLISRVKVNKNG